jgi:phospholipase/carboxylesterase
LCGCRTPDIAPKSNENTTTGVVTPASPARTVASTTTALAATRSPSAGPASTPPNAASAPVPFTAFEYVELATGGLAANARAPLIVAFHGLGDRPENFAGLFRNFPVPARVVLPHSATPHDSGFSWFDFRMGDPDFSAPFIAETADRLATFIAELGRRPTTLGKPIVTGFSQGGALSFALYARHPELIAAAYPLSGWLPPSLVPGARPAGDLPPLIAFHGTADPVVPIAHARTAVGALVALGFPATLREFEGVEHAVPEPVQAALYDALESSARNAAPTRAH